MGDVVIVVCLVLGSGLADCKTGEYWSLTDILLESLFLLIKVVLVYRLLGFLLEFFNVRVRFPTTSSMFCLI